VRIQREVGQIARYMIDMGGDIELFEIAMRVPPWERLRPLTVAELTRLRLHTVDMAFLVKPSLAAASPQVSSASVSPSRSATRTVVRSEFTTANPTIDRSQSRWAVVEAFGGHEIARRSMLTVEGEEVGVFRLSFGCGRTASTLAITYSETRKSPDPARGAHRLSDTIILLVSERVPLRIESGGGGPFLVGIAAGVAAFVEIPFMRSSGSLIQTIGRCARNLNGRAVLYADNMTDSMQKAMDETNRRRAIQEAYNEANGITPQSIVRPLDMSLARIIEADYADLATAEADGIPDFKSQEELDAYIAKLEAEMRETAKRFEFEKAAKLRDAIKELRTKEFLFA